MLIFAFGDSITYGAWDSKGGWADRLKKEFTKHKLKEIDFYVLVYNLGISGDTTRGILKRFENELELRLKDDAEEEIVIIFAIGINDSQFIYEKNKNKVPFSEFKDNLKNLILKARKYTDKIIFIGLTPVDERKVVPLPWDKRKCYKNEHVEKYDKAIEKIAYVEKVKYIPVKNLFPKNKLKEFLFDGLHPNDKGHELIYKAISQKLYLWF